MANSLSSLNREFWTAAVQRSLWVENTAFYVANTALRNLAAGDGDTVNKPILSYPAMATYTPGTDITTQALTASNEQLSIGTWSAALVTIDDTEKVQSYYQVGQLTADRMMKIHKNKLEQAVLAEVTNSLHSIDAGNVGGSAGSDISVTTDNVPMIFTAAGTKLNAVDAPMAGRVAIVGAHTLEQLLLQQANRWTNMGDTVNQVGRIGTLFGWEVVYNNNLRFTASLALASTPTDGDTVSIAGVTFTFKATPVLAGAVDIGTDGPTSLDNLVAAINDSGTVGSTYIQLSAENRFLLTSKRSVVAVDGTTELGITGYGDIVVAETLTAAADVWSAQHQDSLFCVKGAVDLVVQIPPKVEVDRDPDQFADIVKSLLGYGKKTFADGAREMVRVKINASSWV